MQYMEAPKIWETVPEFLWENEIMFEIRLEC